MKYTLIFFASIVIAGCRSSEPAPVGKIGGTPAVDKTLSPEKAAIKASLTASPGVKK